jgi:hypothetical protein
MSKSKDVTAFSDSSHCYALDWIEGCPQEPGVYLFRFSRGHGLEGVPLLLRLSEPDAYDWFVVTVFRDEEHGWLEYVSPRDGSTRVLSSEFILYSRASGLSRKQIARSTLRASLPPVLTLTGILFGFMLGGAVLIEQVFSLNGLGSYSVRAVLNLDYPAIQGTVLVITIISLIVYLILDLVLVFTDPRVKAQ